MAFLDSTPYSRETFVREYYGGGVTYNYRDRVTVAKTYPCDADGADGETIAATVLTTVFHVGETAELQSVAVEVAYGEPTGTCTLLYEYVSDWTLIS